MSQTFRTHVFSEETGHKMLVEMAKQTALLATIAEKSVTQAAMEDWVHAGKAIRDGLGPALMPVGAKVVTPWADSRTNVETVHQMEWNVAHHGTGALEGGATGNVAILHMDKCLPFDTQFSPYQAFLTAVTAIPAGTYNVVFASKMGDRAAGTYQFTLTQDLPIGGQLAGFRGYSGDAVYAYASATAATETETCVVAEGSEGTCLGTFSVAGVPVPASGTPETVTEVGDLRFYGLNSIHRVAYGNNRWLHSPLRQFLNAIGADWWVPKTVFDRPPAYAANDGFLTGFDPDFVAAMQPVAQMTALNYVTDGGTSADPLYDTTYDKVFLPSGKQHHIAASAYYGGAAGLEGEDWEYWARARGSATPASWGYTYPEYKQYDMGSPTTARSCWMRSANRGGGSSVTCVSASGNCTNGSAVSGNRGAAACAIGQIV